MNRLNQLKLQIQDDPTIKIGNAILKISVPNERVVHQIPAVDPSRISIHQQHILEHLKWMIQKGNMRQDMFLIGPPSPLKRLLARDPF
jgi:hypothetical protein